MRIIIIGNGKVGYTLAKQLSGENHDLVLIDKNAEALANAEGVLDILCVEGSGASIRVLREAGVRGAGLVVAVTGSDELNIVCCLIAKKLGAKHTVCRIRNPEYYREANLLKREIGVDLIINPEYAAAGEISRLLRVPTAFSVETFARGRVEMIGFPVQKSDGLAGISLYEFNRRHPNGVLMCAAIRGTEVFVPNGSFVPQVGDKAYIIGSPQETARFFHILGRDGGLVRSLTVLGGSKIATYLAWAVEKVGMKVRIVELDPDKCEALAEKLPGVYIIQGDGTDSEVIESENLLDTDAFVALTNRDEENLLMAMTAQRSGVGTVVAKMNRPNYIEMMREFGVDSIISPKDLTANQITAYVRSMARSQGSAVMENLYKLLGGAVEAVEFTVSSAASFLDTPLKDLNLKDGLLVAAIAREGKTIIPDGSTCIRAGDRVIIMARSIFLQDLDDILR